MRPFLKDLGHAVFRLLSVVLKDRGSLHVMPKPYRRDANRGRSAVLHETQRVAGRLLCRSGPRYRLRRALRAGFGNGVFELKCLNARAFSGAKNGLFVSTSRGTYQCRLVVPR
jgi:hypothetical protein